MSRPLPKVMTVTQAAADRVQEIIENSDKPIAGLKIGVKNGGCAGMEYTLDYAETIEDSADVIEDQGIKIVIDPKAICFCWALKWIMKYLSFLLGLSLITLIRQVLVGAVNLLRLHLLLKRWQMNMWLH